MENRVSFANSSYLQIHRSCFAAFLKSMKCNICAGLVPFCFYYQHSAACFALHEGRKLLLKTNAALLRLCEDISSRVGKSDFAGLQ